MNWNDTLKQKQHELEGIAQWASAVQLGTVRDYCRKAIADIQHQIDVRGPLCLTDIGDGSTMYDTRPRPGAIGT